MAELTALLERQPVDMADVEELLKAPDDLLAQQAREVLGYTMPEQEAVQKRRGAELAETLAAEHIHPFTKESVERYKTAAIRQQTPFLYRHFSNAACMMLAIGGVLAGSAGLLAALTTNQPAWFMLTALGVATIVFGGSGCNLPTFRWTVTPIRGYNRKVPPAALHRAMLLKGRLPKASLCIVELTRQSVSYDPFLVIEYGDRTEYIDVWDEQDFVPERQPVTA